MFNDDNLGQEHEYYKSLFAQLIPLKKKWLSNASWNIVQDSEMLKLLQQSGCCGLFIGFESIQAQQGVRKTGAAANGDADRRQLYTEVVRKLHRSGIAVMGAFIFGFDNDDERVFARTLEFARQSRIDAAQINLLVPYPGTPLYARLKAGGSVMRAGLELVPQLARLFRTEAYDPAGFAGKIPVVPAQVQLLSPYRPAQSEFHGPFLAADRGAVPGGEPGLEEGCALYPASGVFGVIVV